MVAFCYVNNFQNDKGIVKKLKYLQLRNSRRQQTITMKVEF
ncbi:hypothetical protein Gotur_034820 [Gossypium turneri]